MLTLREIRDGVSGILDLIVGKAEAIDRFDCSQRGLVRSFAVVLLLLVQCMIALLAQYRLMGGAEAFGPAGRFLAVQFCGLVIVWVGYPLLVLALSGLIDLRDRYVPFIVTRNWASLPLSVPFLLADVVSLTGLLPVAADAAWALMWIPITMTLRVLIARTATGLALGTAIGLVVLDLVFSMVVMTAINRAFGF